MDATAPFEFPAFPKIARLNRECVVTEKIDGSNGLISIDENGVIMVGSRSRWITPHQDNFGFAKWVEANADDLRKLGPGNHHGEWWGSGIQRGYGLQNGEKRFSLFNTDKWSDDAARPSCCSVVPVMFRGAFNSGVFADAINDLRHNGSKAAPGFMKPEGIIVWHTAARIMLKATLEKDSEWKGAA
jgi:hypothetical protein